MKKSSKCPDCGKLFKPERPTQIYCSLECAEAVITRQTDMESRLAPVSALSDQEFLTFSKAAILMGCSRQYVYKLVSEGKLQASRMSSRMSFIRKTDIDALLQSNPYHRVLPLGMSRPRIGEDRARDIAGQIEDATSKGYITMDEAMKIYNVGNTCIYNNVKKNGVSVCRISGRNYYSKKELDGIFCHSEAHPSNRRFIAPTLLADDPGIEWILPKEAVVLYGKTDAAMMKYVSRYKIPARWIDGRRYYSKTHLDERLSR